METPQVLTPDTAPEATKPIFANILKGFGMLPNLYATMGNSATVLGAALAFDDTLSKGKLGHQNLEIIKLASSEANACEYCIRAHSAILQNMYKMSAADIAGIRNRNHSDAKVNALAELAFTITAKRGWKEDISLDAFQAAGYDQEALVEVFATVAINTLNNYLNHISDTPIDWPEQPNIPAAPAS